LSPFKIKLASRLSLSLVWVCRFILVVGVLGNHLLFRSLSLILSLSPNLGILLVSWFPGCHVGIEDERLGRDIQAGIWIVLLLIGHCRHLFDLLISKIGRVQHTDIDGSDLLGVLAADFLHNLLVPQF
jgi:hypothetical protein